MTVLSTQEAIDAIQRMLSTIDGGLESAIEAFISDGNSLTPDKFDGPSANRFREEWSGLVPKLRDAKTAVRDITDNIRAINQEIQRAGGAQV